MARIELSIARLLDALIGGILQGGTGLAIDGSFYAEIGDLVDQETLEVKSPEQIVAEQAAVKDGQMLLDFGCGTGGHRAFLEQLGFTWIGLNYLDGMESVTAREAVALRDKQIVFYNGIEIPLEDASFDVVYSFQTFEHIQDIGDTFGEIARVLKPGGRLIGAVSYLEQIHDYSTFNFTPYGFKLACHAAGLRIERLYPRSDVFSYLLRRLLIVTSGDDENSLTPLINADNDIHRMIGSYVASRADIKSANLIRLMFSAHFAFDVVKIRQ